MTKKSLFYKIRLFFIHTQNKVTILEDPLGSSIICNLKQFVNIKTQSYSNDIYSKITTNILVLYQKLFTRFSHTELAPFLKPR